MATTKTQNIRFLYTELLTKANPHSSLPRTDDETAVLNYLEKNTVTENEFQQIADRVYALSGDERTIVWYHFGFEDGTRWNFNMLSKKIAKNYEVSISTRMTNALKKLAPELLRLYVQLFKDKQQIEGLMKELMELHEDPIYQGFLRREHEIWEKINRLSNPSVVVPFNKEVG